MILPSTFIFSILLLVLGMVSSGLWTSAFKASGTKWRFELYYFDFAIGVFLAAVAAALTVGSLGWDGFSFIDDIRNAGKKQELYAILAGGVLNLGNMLLLGAISMTGIAVALPIGLGTALVVAAIVGMIANPGSSNTLLMGAGAFCLLAASAVASMAFKTNTMNKLIALVQQGKTKSTKKHFSAKGLLLAGVAGILMGGYLPLLDLARDPDIGLGPYGLVVMMSVGIGFTTFVYNLFFMNLPVQGKVVDFAEYFKGNARAHYMGLVGGFLFTASLLAGFVVSKAEGPAAVSPVLASAFSQGGAIIGTLAGLLVWKEFEGADSKVKSLVTSMLVMLVVGIALITVAPIYNAK